MKTIQEMTRAEFIQAVKNTPLGKLVTPEFRKVGIVDEDGSYNRLDNTDVTEHSDEDRLMGWFQGEIDENGYVPALDAII